MSARDRNYWSVLLLAVGCLVLPLDGAAPPDSPNGADLGTLFPELSKLVPDREFESSFLQRRFTNLIAHKKTARDKVFELFHHRPAPVDPKPEVLERTDYGDYVCERITFATTPEFRVPAYVLVPKKLTKLAPAIIDLHSHGGMFLFGKEKVIDLGDNHPGMKAYHATNYDGRPTATELVKRGYVVISIDALFFGERRVLLDNDRKHGLDRSRYSLDMVKHLNQQCRGKETTLVKGLTFAGKTWPGVVVWDDIRTVDYLLTRKDVDPKRIGCVGISMGGYRAMFLGGMDDRVKAVCVTGFMSTVRPMLKAHLDTHSNVHFLPGLHAQLDWPDVAALHAPQPLLVQQCSKDRLFTLDGMKASVEKIAQIYDKAGVKEQFSGRFYDVPHRFTRDMQDEAFDWFDRQLK